MHNPIIVNSIISMVLNMVYFKITFNERIKMQLRGIYKYKYINYA